MDNILKFFYSNRPLIVGVIVFSIANIVHNSYSFYVHESPDLHVGVRLFVAIPTSVGLGFVILVVTLKGKRLLAWFFVLLETFLNILYYGQSPNGFRFPTEIIEYVLSAVIPICMGTMAHLIYVPKEERNKFRKKQTKELPIIEDQYTKNL
ncbi:MAG: hypothetical protein NZZ41_02635 [Candidatus Dojkabacteria bacterium]|nr:hypothetical protein [Candidatus Dojkabacteria bacterium]